MGSLPHPFSNNIKRVQVYYCYESSRVLDMHNLASFFASCESLESATLHLAKWPSAVPCNAVRIPHVTKICYIFTGCSEDAIRSICDSLCFPAVTQVILRLDFSGWDGVNRPTFNSHIDYGISVKDVLLRHPYLSITRLEIDMSTRTVPGIPAPFLPPLALLPNLKELVLSSTNEWDEVELLTISDGVHIPALRMLAVMMEFREWRFVSYWVVALMARLKQQGDLDEFELLRVDEIQESGYKPSDLEGTIHDYLPEYKIVLEGVKE